MGPKNPAIPRKRACKSMKILDESHGSKEKFFRNSKKREQLASATRIQTSILEETRYKLCLENYIGLGSGKPRESF